MSRIGMDGLLVLVFMTIEARHLAMDRDMIISKESKETMYTPTISTSGKILPYGLGWFVQEYKGIKMVWHYGHALQQFQVHAVLWAFSNLIKVPLVWFFISLQKNLSMVIYALILAEVISLIVGAYWVRYRFRLNQRIVS